MTIPAEVLKKIKLLEVNTKKLVNTIFAGQYHSAFKGQGMTFADFREYVPGDDVRSIAWTLTARSGNTYIKKFEEERELTLILAVDVSGSVDFGSDKYFKGEVLTHLSALLSFAAAKNNDNVGLLLFSDQVEHYVPPKKGRGHLQRLLRDLYYHQPKSHRTSIPSLVEFLSGVLKKRSTVFIFSDFMDPKPFATSLKRLSRRHDTIAVRIKDPIEEQFPSIGMVDFIDPESGEVMTLDTSSIGFSKHYKKYFEQYSRSIEQELRKARVDLIEVENGEDFVQPLANYFKKRNK
ncbi:MAG: DUF58 domain-containing protein [Bdellovibrionales bacterium]|nr:DUF58 domain-containing protein [Bdellovibrionales bacterium]